MPKHNFQGGRAFDAGLAALASLSAGFLVFAMPEPIFSGLVETSRLPALVPAAQPPLGDTARFAVLAAVAIFTFSAVWALMAALGRAPAGTPVEPEVEAPRLRRADAHPDAPARRPLLARDLGEPLELDEVAPAPPEAAEPEEVDHRPLPGFLIPQAVDPTQEEAEAQPEAEPVAAFQEPDSEVQAPAAPETEAELEAAPEVEAPARPLPLAELADHLPEAAEETDQPLAQLVNRIEFGLARKRQALPAEIPPAEEAPVEQEKVGHRLRSAINDLQKIASSGA